MLNALLEILERRARIGFNAKIQVIRAEGYHIHTRLRQLADVNHSIHRLDLQDEDTVIVPPLGVFQAAQATLNTVAVARPPTSFAALRIVESIDCLIHRFNFLHLRNDNRERAQIQQIADEIGVARMLNPKLHANAEFRRHFAICHQLQFVRGRMLMVCPDKRVVVSAENGRHFVLSATEGNAAGDFDRLFIANSLFQRHWALLLR